MEPHGFALQLLLEPALIWGGYRYGTMNLLWPSTTQLPGAPHVTDGDLPHPWD